MDLSDPKVGVAIGILEAEVMRKEKGGLKNR